MSAESLTLSIRRSIVESAFSVNKPRVWRIEVIESDISEVSSSEPLIPSKVFIISIISKTNFLKSSEEVSIASAFDC